MATVDVDGSILQADSQPKSVVVVWGLSVAWRSVCINRIEWISQGEWV